MAVSNQPSRRTESWVVFLSSFPPRECGVATFTQHLAEAVDEHTPVWFKTKVVALSPSKTKHYTYPKKVIAEVVEGDREQFAAVARSLNANPKVRLVIVEHEFGLFGGEYGDAVLAFYEALEKPVFTTTHTVMPNPAVEYLRSLQAVAAHSTRVVAMNRTAADLLQQVYGVPAEKILQIPHGIPYIAPYDNSVTKKELGFTGRRLISTFGLLNPDKGIEVVLEALPEIVKQFPDILYLVVGETHPNIVERSGEGYRLSLVQLVEQLGLTDHVRFVKEYLPEKQLVRYLKATDIYVNSSQNPDQIVSGTLSYAVGAGNAVVSSPFLHAKEYAAEGLCLLADFQNPAAYVAPILDLLKHPDKLEALQHSAYVGTRHMTWPNVALAYAREMAEYLPQGQVTEVDLPALPTVRLGHLLRLTDTFGVIQFARYTTPDRDSGYSVDDVARALLALGMHWSIYKKALVFRPMAIYLNFIEHVSGDGGRFYNYADIERRVDTVDWSRDAHARTMWALGYIMDLRGVPRELREQAARLFRGALPVLAQLSSPRSMSFAMAGLYYAYRADRAPTLYEAMVQFADQLVKLYEQHARHQWQWFEDVLTYSNSKLPEALLLAYKATGNKRYLEVAETTLDFLRSETIHNGVFHPIGQAGWYVKGQERMSFDQQPIDAASMTRTLVIAHRMTKKQMYRDEAAQTYHWFLGRNVLHQMVYDEETGGCRDGISPHGISLNQGAESTIVHLMARFCIDTRVKLL